MIANDSLLKAVEASNIDRASEEFKKILGSGADAWDIHLSLFPVAQRVQNPPFINPHLPKMHRTLRELMPYLRKEEIPALIELEIVEYTRRPKLEKLPRHKPLKHPVSFHNIESGIKDLDWEKTAGLMTTFFAQHGGAVLARNLLLLGSGYLESSLGHSISCTGFMLLEMLERKDQDPWPVLATLADYFCKGRFMAVSFLENTSTSRPGEATENQLLKATSGRGIVNLHHTITLYVIERVRHLFNQKEYNFIIRAWLDFMGDKGIEKIPFESERGDPSDNYAKFSYAFAEMSTETLIQSAVEMIATPKKRRQLCGFLIKSLCDNYQKNYDPHYLTGLGATLWIVNRFWDQPQIVANAFSQYLDYYFSGIN